MRKKATKIDCLVGDIKRLIRKIKYADKDRLLELKMFCFSHYIDLDYAVNGERYHKEEVERQEKERRRYEDWVNSPG